MKLYNYNAFTKEFTKATDAKESPLEKGQFLIPANATVEEPPETREGYVSLWNGSEWVLTEDNRGIIVYDISTKASATVNYTGKIKSGFTKTKPAEYDIWDSELKSWAEDTGKKTEAKKKALIAEALIALSDSDIIILRCYESSIGVPEEWKAYRSELRLIAKGDSTLEKLPNVPVEPSKLMGTKNE